MLIRQRLACLDFHDQPAVDEQIGEVGAKNGSVLVAHFQWVLGYHSQAEFPKAVKQAVLIDLLQVSPPRNLCRANPVSRMTSHSALMSPVMVSPITFATNKRKRRKRRHQKHGSQRRGSGRLAASFLRPLCFFAAMLFSQSHLPRNNARGTKTGNNTGTQLASPSPSPAFTSHRIPIPDLRRLHHPSPIAKSYRQKLKQNRESRPGTARSNVARAAIRRSSDRPRRRLLMSLQDGPGLLRRGELHNQSPTLRHG
jgi:hypothetical protein